MRIENRPSNVKSILLRILLFGFVMIVAFGLAFVLLRGRTGSEHRGAVYGVPEKTQSGGDLQGLGVNIDLTRLQNKDGAGSPAYTMDDALTDIKRAGLSWIRQPFPWSELEPERGRFAWQAWDDVVAACEKHDIDLVAVLYTSPPWARSAAGRDERFAPPASLVDFGEFARALASRYGASLDYYQIWDAPNIQPNWGDSLVDPTGYMRLLREAGIQIKSIDPTASVILAGLAPTTQAGPLNMHEALFLQNLYAAGAASFFDVVAAKPYGFWSGPEDRRLDVPVLNFSRLALLRDIMVENGDSEKPVWAVEMGWNALPAGWSGDVSPWGTDVEELQTERTLNAIQRARIEWPWLTAMALAEFMPPESLDDPRSGFALIDRNRRPRELYRELVDAAQSEAVAYPGYHAADDPAIQYQGEWRVRPLAADVGEEGDVLELPFYGTRIDLEVRRGRFWGLFYVSVDGQPANGLPKDDEGRAYLVLHDPLEREATVTLASGLEDGLHRLEMKAHGGWEQWPLLGFMVVRERASSLTNTLAILCLLFGIGAMIGTAYNGLLLPWDSWWPAVVSRFERLGQPVQLLLLALLALVFYFSPNVWLSLLCLGGLACLACLRPALGLALVVFTVPFFLEIKHLPGRTFNLTELALIMAVAGLAVYFAMEGISALKGNARRTLPDASSIRQSLASVRDKIRSGEVFNLDVAMVLWVIAGGISVVAAENFGVANREFRVVMLEPAIFYLLLRIFPGRRRETWLLSDALILAGVTVALIGLYQYVFTADIISAEGVRRIRGVYASPNNLSLFLGRVLSLLAALILSLPFSRRQILYGLAVVPVAICLYLTYSRGAWLVGLPAALLFIVLVRRGRTLWMGLIALGLLLLSLVPLASTERLSQLLNLRSETAFLRLKLWQGTVQMIREHPILGVGLDNFLYQYRTRYVLPDAWREPNLSHPHNIILDYWTRLGILGLFVLFWQQLNFFRLGFRTYRDSLNGFDRALVLALLTTMVYSLAHGLIDNSFFLVDLSFALVLVIGLMIRLHKFANG